MTTQQAGPSSQTAEATSPRQRGPSYWVRVGQMVLAEGAGALVAGAPFLARAGLTHPSRDPEATYHWLNKGLVAMAIGLVAAILGWFSWTIWHRRVRWFDVPTALLLVVAPLIGFFAISFSYYESYLDE